MTSSPLASWQSERLAIRDLIDRSSDAINHQDWPALAALQAENVVWERLPPMPWTLRGRDAVRGFLTGNSDKLDVLLYSIAATTIEVEDVDHATARSTMSELIRLRETGTALHVVGTYSDVFVRREGNWLFLKRTIQPRYEEDVAPPQRIFSQTDAGASALQGVQR